MRPLGTKINWKMIRVDEINIIRPGAFFLDNKNEKTNTVYLKCNFEGLPNIYYKTDYLPFEPHITLYDGKSREFAKKLLEKISNYSWEFVINLRHNPKESGKRNESIITEKTIDKRYTKRKELLEYDEKVKELFWKITKTKLSITGLLNLTDDEKLAIIGNIYQYLHSSIRNNNNIHDNRIIQLQMKLLDKYSDNFYNPREKRALLGQFKTPPELAIEIVKYIKTIIDKKNYKIDFGDPAIGSGTFYYAIEKVFENKLIHSAIGIEIDSEISKLTRDYFFGKKIKIINQDYFKFMTKNKRNVIISNPPYVRYQLIEKNQKIELSRKIQDQFGIQVNGQSSLYIYFLLLCHNWMKRGAYSAWLIPSEFLEVCYGRELKKYLLENVSLIRIHRFDPNELQFEGVLVTSALIVFKNVLPSKNNKFIFSYGGDIFAPKKKIFIYNREIQYTDKWNRLLLRNTAYKNRKDEIKLGDLFTIKRGIATGANSFFILDKNKALELGIPKLCVRPILPNPKYIETEIIYKKDDGYPDIRKQLVVIDSDLDIDEIKKNYPKFWRYLETATKDGIILRTLVKSRKPWYKQERRDVPLFLFTYMGRKTIKTEPFRFILNYSEAIATNQYLLLYPKEKILNALISKKVASIDILKLLNKINKEDFINQGRVYGGGLYKIEPNEIKLVNANIIDKIL